MSVIDWLLDADPAIRWQVMRDLTDAAPDEVAAERARVATEGWGARILALQVDDGQWGGDTYHPYWTSTTYTLLLLWYLGIDPESAPVRRATDLVADRVRFQWTETDTKPFFDGEVEACINGMVLKLGAYFGHPAAALVERLLGEQISDGGWNCFASVEEYGDEADTWSSVNTTITVLEGLLEYERTTGFDPALTAARGRAYEYLLDRRLFRRKSTGEVIDETFTRFSFPPYWRYDVLRALDHMRDAGVAADDRMTEAIELVESKRDNDGRWPLENTHPGETHFDMEAGDGEPSRWNTLRALRVLDWFGA